MADDAKSWIAIAVSAFAVAGTVYSSFASRRSQMESARLTAELQRERDLQQARRDNQIVLSRFRDPLMHASFDLQSRIFGMLRRNFLGRFYLQGNPHEREYSVENTAFLFAQFLGWTEAIREEVQFLDLQIDDRTRELRSLQENLSNQLRTDKLPDGFRFFSGEQRAVGELMLNREGAILRCIGFAAFVSCPNPAINRWLDPLRDDIRAMAENPAQYEPRLIAIQHALIDLLDFLDPGQIRFPDQRRSKVV